MKGFVAIMALSLALLAASADAHEVRPAYLELRETAPDTYEVFWKVPAREGAMRLALDLQFPPGTELLGEPRGIFTDTVHVERSRVRRAGGFDGQIIGITGLVATRTDVLARIVRLDGVTQMARATPDAPAFVVEAAPSVWQLARAYLGLGVEHILLGVDHLLFVLALVLLVAGWRRLVATITAFTLAHSITLAAATLGVVHVPGPPVEACIALSIVFVAAEMLHARRGRPGLTARRPWLVAFSFGLLHGLGFAGALSEVGLPEQAIPLALLFFNLGVEAGQLAFIAVALAAIALLRKVSLPQWSGVLAPYAIGGVAMFWVIQRVAAF